MTCFCLQLYGMYVVSIYTNSLINADLFYVRFTNTTFHLHVCTTYKPEILSLSQILLDFVWSNLLNMKFGKKVSKVFVNFLEVLLILADAKLAPLPDPPALNQS